MILLQFLQWFYNIIKYQKRKTYFVGFLVNENYLEEFADIFMSVITHELFPERWY